MGGGLSEQCPSTSWELQNIQVVGLWNLEAVARGNTALLLFYQPNITSSFDANANTHIYLRKHRYLESSIDILRIAKSQQACRNERVLMLCPRRRRRNLVCLPGCFGLGFEGKRVVLEMGIEDEAED
jgi:hypothetical protein